MSLAKLYLKVFLMMGLSYGAVMLILDLLSGEKASMFEFCFDVIAFGPDVRYPGDLSC